MIENILCGSNYDGYLWNKIFQKRIIENNNLKFLEKYSGLGRFVVCITVPEKL